MKIDQVPSVRVMRRLAKARLPKPVFDFIDGGAEDELTLKDNRRAFNAYRFKPRVFRDVSAQNLEQRVFDDVLPMPVMIGPTGLAALAWPDSEPMLARAAEAVGIPFTLSTGASASIEDIAATGCSRRWFQLYVFRDRKVTRDLLDRARDNGFDTLIVTADVPVVGKRERDVMNAFTLPLQPTPRMFWEFATHPAWSLATLKAGAPIMANVAQYASVDSSNVNVVTHAAWINREFDPSVTWDNVQEVRDLWSGRMLVKGVLTLEDTRHAKKLGVDGVIISNHGGRQLDGAVSSLRALELIAPEMNGQIPLFLDSGVRRGSDVIKALCLGATAVFLGRATLFGAAAGGEAGVTRTLQIIKEEIDRSLALIGVNDIGMLDASFLDR